MITTSDPHSDLMTTEELLAEARELAIEALGYAQAMQDKHLYGMLYDLSHHIDELVKRSQPAIATPGGEVRHGHV
jgi:hypothetical protein